MEDAQCIRRWQYNKTGIAVTKRKWYSLYDKVYAMSNLERAWKKVRSNRGAGGVDRQTIANFAEAEEKHLKELHRLLREKQYRPQALRRVYIPKGRKRTTIGNTGGAGQSGSIGVNLRKGEIDGS